MSFGEKTRNADVVSTEQPSARYYQIAENGCIAAKLFFPLPTLCSDFRSPFMKFNFQILIRKMSETRFPDSLSTCNKLRWKEKQAARTGRNFSNHCWNLAGGPSVFSVIKPS